ncbi:MAG: radical SAM protein, partial [Nanoarchaeota archaeon]|nr:radical SAM protein [Nanoarchaeota archaeon]
EINVPYRAIAHPLYVDEEVAKLLKESGCFKLEMGVQTFNEEVKRKMMTRIEKNEDIVRALKACSKYKLNFFVDHMFGFGETDAELRHALLLYNEYRPTRITCYWLQYFPATSVIDKTGATEEQRKEAEEGKENTYITGGSVKDENVKKIAKQFQFIMKGLQLYPKWLVKFFLASNIYKVFHLIPPLPFELMVAIKKSDYRIFNYIGYYTFHFRKRIKTRLGLGKKSDKRRMSVPAQISGMLK